MKKLTLLSIFFMITVVAFAQKNTVVSGVVKSIDGEVLPGATISSQLLKLKTITNVKGEFEIKTTLDDVLEVTYLGFKTQFFPLAGKNKVIIELKSADNSLEQVIVVGYGTQKKKDLTGAVSNISGDLVSDRKATQVSQALQGAVAGVTVTRSSGAPGATGTVLVRGVTSLGSTSPLVLIDGTPGSIDDVNPDDIADISVLKDAASSAIYGSRAAAGVILITTKRAKEGVAKFSYNSDFGWQTPSVQPKFADVQTYMRLYNELLVNDGTSPQFSEDYINKYLENNKLDPDSYPNTDWLNSFLKTSAFQQRHFLDFSIGSEKIKSQASFGYISQDALSPNQNYERLTFRVNNDFELSSKLKGLFDVNFKRSLKHSPYGTGDNSYFYTATQLPPLYGDYYSDGRYAEGKGGANPVANAREDGYSNAKYNNLSGRIGLVFNPLKELTFTGIVSPELDFARLTDWQRIGNFTAKNDPTVVTFRSGTVNSLKENSDNSTTLNLQFLANYDRVIKKDHTINFLLGFENNTYNQENFTAYRDGFIFPNYTVLDAGATAAQATSGNGSQTALRSFFGRAMYNYKGKYLIQSNARIDGSSRFDRDYRWGFFPSIAGGWVISEEPFSKKLLKDNYLKVRASWGRLGNQNIGNYPYISQVSLGNNLFYDGNSIVPLVSGGISDYAVKDITWETTESADYGLDLITLRNRLELNFDYYNKHTYNLLYKLPVPLFTGLTAPFQNAAEMKTKGFDLNISWRDKINEFHYSIGANLSDSKSNVTNLKGTSTLGTKALLENQEYNVWYGYKSLGLFQSQSEIASSALLTGKEQPGDMKYQDIDGDGKITADKDRVPLGGSLPRYTYGGFIEMSYKNFDFNTSFQGIGKQINRLSGIIVQPFVENFGNVSNYIVNNYWTPQNTTAHYPRLTYKNDNSVNYVVSDYWLTSGAYFRVKNMTLGYTLPKDIVKKAGIANLRVYLSGTDLLLISKYPKGWDVESPSSGYPITTTYYLGVNVQF
ncbi:TonB-dependent receptor [Pedobacter sp. SD-b]|uniref:TonB-dependent receptor n=1 Tax=Pedobacter segetis TaxID=2793069 RepID=A0ABS1BGH7_9SPHI|nr:TonB-dependent receptor [Pedobacter segetis]MBK0381942.1 TonB-dependent receptor [Pedobacter segetis]